MPERNVMEQMPEPLYLSQEKKKCSRSLSEKVFAEDSARFVEFYYTYKTRENQILALEQDGMLVSMLHLNPYRMVVNGYETPANYIVAVATKKEYRHRGYMRLLLEKALKDMGDQGMPFTFLMPASEKIYAPFDFVWICSYTNLPPRVERTVLRVTTLLLAADMALSAAALVRMEGRRTGRPAAGPVAAALDRWYPDQVLHSRYQNLMDPR